MSDQHVVQRDEGWVVRKEGAERDTSLHPTQKEAIDAATEIAKHQKAEVFIHDRHGKIRERNSFGNDPYPPPG